MLVPLLLKIGAVCSDHVGTHLLNHLFVVVQLCCQPGVSLLQLLIISFDQLQVLLRQLIIVLHNFKSPLALLLRTLLNLQLLRQPHTLFLQLTVIHL